jgi:hypothetical protein
MISRGRRPTRLQDRKVKDQAKSGTQPDQVRRRVDQLRNLVPARRARGPAKCGLAKHREEPRKTRTSARPGADCPKFHRQTAPRSRPVLIAAAAALTDRNGQTVRVGNVTRTTTAGIVLKSTMIAIVCAANVVCRESAAAA